MHFLPGDNDELTSKYYCLIRCGLRSKRVEEVGPRMNGRARAERETREGGGSSLPSRVISKSNGTEGFMLK